MNDDLERIKTYPKSVKLNEIIELNNGPNFGKKLFALSSFKNRENN
tara:strand:+ start:20 stop:157 length:138 start_codon:yes stop_codon:yes gene_type:complete